MHRSKLISIYSKCRNEGNWSNCKKQINFCANLLLKTKAEYLQNLNVKDLPEKKNWKAIKLCFSNKVLSLSKLMLKEKNRLITEEKELATVINTFFVSINADQDIQKDNDSS